MPFPLLPVALAPPTLIQTATVNNNYATTATVSVASTKSGNLLLLGIGTYGTATYSMPSGWTALPSSPLSAGSLRQLDLWYYPNNPGGITSVTVTANGQVYIEAVFAEFSGVAAANALDTSATRGTDGTTATTASLATPQAVAAANELTIGFFGIDNSSAFTAASGWTLAAQQAFSGYINAGLVYAVSSAAVVETPGVSWTGAQQWAGITIAFHAVPNTARRVVSQQAVLQATTRRSVSQTAVLRATSARTVPQQAALQQQRITRSIGQSATLAAAPRLIPQQAILLAHPIRTVAQHAVLLQRTLTRVVADVAAVQQQGLARVSAQQARLRATLSRAVPTTAIILAHLARTIPQQAAVREQQPARSIPQLAALQKQRLTTPPVPQSGIIGVSPRRTVPQTGMLFGTFRRSIRSSGTFSGAVWRYQRGIAQAAALYGTAPARGVPQQAQLSGLLLVPQIAHLSGRRSVPQLAWFQTRFIAQRVTLSLVTLTRVLAQQAALRQTIGLAGQRRTTQTAALLGTPSRSIGQSVLLQVVITGTRTMAQTAALQFVLSGTRTTTQVARFVFTGQRSVSQALVNWRGARPIPQQAQLGVNTMRWVGQGMTLRASLTRSISQTYLSGYAGQLRAVMQTMRLSVPWQRRGIAQYATLFALVRGVRAVPQTVALQQRASARAVPQNARLGGASVSLVLSQPGAVLAGQTRVALGAEPVATLTR